MYKAVVLWEQEPEPGWYASHAGLCKKVPSATFRAGRIFGPNREPDRQLLAEFEFPDRESFDRGMGSDEMKTVVEDAQTQDIPFHVYVAELA